MDFARHFLPEGPDGRDYPTELFIGPCFLLRFDADTILDARTVRDVVPETPRLLVATYPNTLHVTPDGAEELLRKGLRLIGTDTVTVELGPPFDSHKTLLAAGCVIVEGLLLDGTREGRYLLVCLPMKYDDSDGAPCRALLADVDRLCAEIRS
jgi:arylformamidase